MFNGTLTPGPRDRLSSYTNVGSPDLALASAIFMMKSFPHLSSAQLILKPSRRPCTPNPKP